MGRIIRQPGTLVITFIFLCLVIPAILVVAARLRDPELIGRFGALLSALGAVLVIYQAIVEARIEKSEAVDARTRSTLSPPNRELAEKIMRERSERRKLERIKIVVAIAALVFVGEIMHGWGKYFYIGVAVEAPDQIQGQPLGW